MHSFSKGKKGYFILVNIDLITCNLLSVMIDSLFSNVAIYVSFLVQLSILESHVVSIS